MFGSWSVRCGCLIAILSLVGCSQSAWRESSPDGKFKILAPDELVEENPSDKGPTDRIWGITERHGRYMVYTSEVGQSTSPEVIQQALERIARDLIEKTEAKLRTLTPIKLNDKYLGVEIEGDHPTQSASIRARIYYSPGRIYRIIVSGKNAWFNLAEVNKYFDSFEILP